MNGLCEPSPLTWGNFQSVIQLSVALNTAYVVLFVFVDDTLKQKLANASRKLDALKNLDPDVPDGFRQRSKARSDIGRVYQAERFVTRFHRQVLKPFCAIFSLLGVIALMYSSYKAGHDIWNIQAALMCALFIPPTSEALVYLSVWLFLNPKYQSFITQVMSPFERPPTRERPAP